MCNWKLIILPLLKLGKCEGHIKSSRNVVVSWFAAALQASLSCASTLRRMYSNPSPPLHFSTGANASSCLKRWPIPRCSFSFKCSAGVISHQFCKAPSFGTRQPGGTSSTRISSTSQMPPALTVQVSLLHTKVLSDGFLAFRFTFLEVKSCLLCAEG